MLGRLILSVALTLICGNAFAQTFALPGENCLDGTCKVAKQVVQGTASVVQDVGRAAVQVASAPVRVASPVIQSFTPRVGATINLFPQTNYFGTCGPNGCSTRQQAVRGRTYIFRRSR